MRSIIEQVIQGLNKEEKEIFNKILNDKTLIPNKDYIFNGFNIPRNEIKYIIFGESPYPRIESATGHAFIDGKVKEIWGEEGLSKEVNRATSLRNLFKTALVADNFISPDNATKENIKHIKTEGFVNTMSELQHNLNNNGVALLNSCLSLREGKVQREDVNFWSVLLDRFLLKLMSENKSITLVLWGNISKRIKNMESFKYYDYIESEHPYNKSFIENKKMQHFLKEINFLYK